MVSTPKPSLRNIFFAFIIITLVEFLALGGYSESQFWSLFFYETCGDVYS